MPATTDPSATGSIMPPSGPWLIRLSCATARKRPSASAANVSSGCGSATTPSKAVGEYT